MTRLIIPLILFLAACANVPLPATEAAQPTAQVTAQVTVQVTVQPEQPERMVMRSTVTPTPALHKCAVTANVLTVRTCGGVQCAAIDWLMAGEIVTTTQVISGWIPAGAGWVNSKFCQEVK